MATNLWSIKAYKAFIPTEYKLGNTQQHISTPIGIDDNMENQPRLNRCDPEEERLLWYQKLAHMPFNSYNIYQRLYFYLRVYQAYNNQISCMFVRESQQNSVEGKVTEITHHKCH
jgi:hypothetical protein